MAFQCVTTCSNLVIICQTEYSILSQQLRCLCVREPGSCLQTGYLNWYATASDEAGASSDCIIYLSNGILCIFRQPLKYLCFSYSFLDELRKYDAETLDSSSRKIYWK